MASKAFLFISNGSKPSSELLQSTEPIGPGTFSCASIWAANEMGWELHMGINRNHPEKIKSIGYNIRFYNQHIYRNIFAVRDNWKAYRNLCQYLKDNPDVEIIHCNTPIGGLVGRLAGSKFRKKLIYTAHGFHFYQGAPLFNRTILKWVEKWLAHKTDILITINEEDYHNALKMHLKENGMVYKIPGVGIDLSKFNSMSPGFDLRESLNLKQTDFVCISLGELNVNKNYSTIIKAIAQIKSKDIHYLICGEGPLKHKLIELAKSKKVADNIHFLGYRTDVKDLLAISNCAVIPSIREGLPRTTMEAMASGLPCIVSDIRGNRDLIDEGKGGYLVQVSDTKGFANAINVLMNNGKAHAMGEYNRDKIKEFDINIVKSILLEIYKNVLS